jgi:LmbE family N-acetylglucosaminyl deacetylase
MCRGQNISLHAALNHHTLLKRDSTMLQQPFHRIYLSPHLDDAALSCGGLIHQECQAGLEVLVVTVLAGDPPSAAKEMPTPILAELHTRWELEKTSNPVAARRAEDRAAMSILDADYAHWEWPECVYRRHPHSGVFLYPSEESLWGAADPAEKGLIAQLARRLDELPLAPGGQVYVPLTVGGHVDHHLVSEAVKAWGVPEGEQVFYEEYPYAEHPSALTAALGDHIGWRAEIVPLDDAALAAKAQAVACYRSQISTFFSSTDEILARLQSYAAIAGEGQGWAERYWRRD